MESASYSSVFFPDIPRVVGDQHGVGANEPISGVDDGTRNQNQGYTSIARWRSVAECEVKYRGLSNELLMIDLMYNELSEESEDELMKMSDWSEERGAGQLVTGKAIGKLIDDEWTCCYTAPPQSNGSITLRVLRWMVHQEESGASEESGA
ncbi:hypothetical protein Tco_1253409 [Tanacetum coccineum]